MKKKKKPAVKKKGLFTPVDFDRLDLLSREVLAYAQSGIIVYGPDLRYRFFSPFMENITGLSASEVVGKLPLEVFPFLKSTGLMDELKKILAGGKTVRMQFPYSVKKTGKSGWAEGWYHPFPGKEGRVAGIIGSVRDITDYKMKEFSLQEEKERFTGLFENMRSGAAIYEAVDGGRDFRFLGVNRSAERIDNISRKDLVGRLVTEAFPGVVKLGLFDVLRRVWKSGAPEQLSATLYSDDRISGWRDNFVYKLPSGEIVALYEDVGEKMRAAEALLLSEERYRTLAETAQDAIYIIGGDMRMEYINSFGARGLGFSPPDIIGKEHRMLFPAEMASRQEKVFRRILDTGRMEALEEEVRFPDGSMRWLDTRLVPLQDDSGRVRAVMGMSRDITGRKLAESALADNETRYRTIFDQASDSILVLEGGRGGPPIILDANAAALRMHGYTREELIGRPITVLDAEASAVSLAKRRFELIKASGSAKFEVRHKRKDGSILLLEASVRVITIAGKEMLIDISRDLTERKRTEDELRASEKRYKDIFDTSNDALMLLTPEKGFFRGNPATVRLFGCADEAEFVSMGPADLSPEYQPDGTLSSVKAQGMMAMAMEKGSHFFEWTHKRAGGEEFFATVLLTRTELDDGPALQATVRDITESKKLEETLRSAQKLESVGLLAGGIAHDFNNMLTGITGNLSLLDKRPGLDTETKEVLAEMAVTASRAQQLANRLLVFSKGGEPVRKLLDIWKVLEESVSFVSHGSNCRIELSVPERRLTVLGDESQLSQAFGNMALNAIQAMSGGGVVRIKAEELRLDSSSGLPPGDYVKITVADSGPGISADDMRRIFVPYFSTKPGGHGLGLSISYSVFLKHGGSLAAETGAAGGAVFTVHLPTAEGAAGSVMEPGRKPPAAAGGRVLVMDDDETVQRSVCRMLKALGYEHAVVPEGAGAIEAYRAAAADKRPFAAVIMDLTIPGGMGGKEAVSKLKALYPEAKVLVSSGYSDDPVMSDFRNYGFDAALAKPYKLEELGRILAELTASDA